MDSWVPCISWELVPPREGALLVAFLSVVDIHNIIRKGSAAMRPLSTVNVAVCYYLCRQPSSVLYILLVDV